MDLTEKEKKAMKRIHDVMVEEGLTNEEVGRLFTYFNDPQTVMSYFRYGMYE
jgi:hypothetical protein|tara:strand:- start:3804 stop:3959 length:156 start_codon:yes stop_codon:yes gene_type:complete